MTTGDGAPHSDEVECLRTRVAEAREQVASALAAIDDIELRQNPQIEAAYVVRVGRYETDLLKSEIAARRARRKLAMVNHAVGMHATVDDEAIEAELDAEFIEWDAKVKREMARFYAMRDFREAVSTDEDAASEMRQLYVNLVKRLHPEIRSELDPVERLLYLAAQMAYQQGDVDALRSLDSVTFDLPDGSWVDLPQDGSAADALHAEAVSTEATAASYREQLDVVRAKFPYRYKEKLADDEWIASRVADLQKLVERNLSAAQRDTERAAEVLKG